MKYAWITAAAMTTVAGIAGAQQVTVYGRIGVSLAQQADAIENKEVRNDMGSRLGVRGSEELGSGLKAVFDIQHRFNANTGEQSNATRFWEGKSIVGLEGNFGRVSLGREENPAYTFAQDPVDPWGTYTVASNGSVINGRIGSTRYSNSANYAVKVGDFGIGAQIAEATGNANGDTPGVDKKKPYAVGLGYAAGALKLGLGYENPANPNDNWATVLASYDFGVVKLAGMYGTGRNVNDEKHQAYMVSVTAPIGAGELRASYGNLKNKDTSIDLDDQYALGYYYKLSKRTALYATVAHEGRDNMPDANEKTGYDIGVRHDF